MEDRLQKFSRLVDAGSFTKASTELHMSQPALSMAIGKLERELRTTLFVRGARPLRLTPAGELAYAAAQELAARTHNLASQLAALADEPVSIGLGMIDSAASTLFLAGDALAQLERRAKISVVVNNSRFLLEAAARSRIDMAFIAEQSRALPTALEATFVATEPLVAICHASQHAETQQLMRRGRLPHFISYDQPSTSYELICRALQQQGITPEPAFYSTSPEVMLRLALLGRGTAVLPYLLVRNHIQDGTIALLGHEQPTVIGRRISSVKRRDATPAVPLTPLFQTLQKLISQLNDEVSGLAV